MSTDELSCFLAQQRTGRVATVSRDGAPHVSPLWFLWYEEALWLHSLVTSQRWSDLRRDPRVAVVIDDGEGYGELRGVELAGRAEPVGQVPRTGGSDVTIDDVERRWAAKYRSGEQLAFDGRHAWLRIAVERIVSWDFSKLEPR